MAATQTRTQRTPADGWEDNFPLRGASSKSTFQVRQAVDESDHGQRTVRRAVARAREGDRNALHFLYVRYSDNVYGYVLSIVRDDYEAEDITQHVFAKLMIALARYDQRAVPFLAWLLRLSHNAAIDHLRARRPTPVEEVRASVSFRDDSMLDSTTALHGALETLPSEQRSVLLMRHLYGYSPSEIADCMGRTESSIHGLHHRGRRALQAELRRLECAPATARPAVGA